MKSSFFVLLFCLILGVALAWFSQSPKHKVSSPLERLVFTSCIWHHDPTIWQQIASHSVSTLQPDAFLFLGDAVYSDYSPTGKKLTDFAYRSKGYSDQRYTRLAKEANTPARLLQALTHFQSTSFYQELKSYFIALSKEKVLLQNKDATPGILAVWDDHDYGYSDAGSWHPDKTFCQTIFQGFFGIGPRPHSTSKKGLYSVYYTGTHPNRVQLIVLDCRYFKTSHFQLSDLKKDQVTLLGEEQWQWLKKTLQEPAAIRLIASSLPVIPNDIYAYQDNGSWKKKDKERWAMFGHERQRLFELLSNSSGTLAILSGDWHLADLSRITHNNKTIYELSAGGWHTADKNYKGPRKLRRRFKHEHSIPSVQADMPPRYWQSFGVVDIDWEQRILTLSAYNNKGEVEPGYQQRITFP